MQIDPRLLFGFTNWANDRVVEGAKQLTSEQLTAPLRPGFLSSLELLVHIMAAEWVWLSRWQGASPQKLLSVEDIPTLEALQQAWTPLRAEMLNFVTTIDDPNAIVEYPNTQGIEFRRTLWPLVLHVVNHGTEHRSQVALYLAMHGIDVGNLDLIQYLTEIT
jgi:uncharacterized damage-inducible protein DinB